MGIVTGAPTASQAVGTETFIQTLGVNTHIDFQAYGYQNLAVVEQAINYLGVVNLRDDPENPADLGPNGWWQQVADATGAKFDAFLAEGPPAQMEGDLGRAALLAQQGLLNFIEGGNEEDDPYAVASGNSLAIAATYQQTVYQVAHDYDLPAIDMSFGQGWTPANGWHGDYDKVGNLAPYADYANAHTYPSGAPESAIQALNGDAQIAAVGRPVITTEIGWDTTVTDPVTAAKYTLDAALDGFKDGDVKTYFYSLFDDGSGAFGLMNADGTPKPAGAALHNLLTLLSDPGANATGFTPGSLAYSVSGAVNGDNSLLLQKTDGSYWLALWDETAAAHVVTFNLGAPAAAMLVFDPLAGTTAIESASNVDKLQITLSDHPVLVEISGAQSGGSPTPNDLSVEVPAGLTLAAGSTVTIAGVSIGDPWALTAGGTMALNVYDLSGTIGIAGHVYGPGGAKVAGGMVTGTEAQLNADLAGLTYTAGASAGTDTLSVDVWNQAGVEVTETVTVTVTGGDTGPIVTLSSAPTIIAGTIQTLTGISIADPIGNGPGTMVLNLNVSGGTISLTDSDGNPVAGSGTAAISVTGTLAQLERELTRLSFTADDTAGNYQLSVNVWDQYGQQTTSTLDLTVAARSVITLPPSHTRATIDASDVTVVATAGNHTIFIGGSNDVITVSGGQEAITALAGGNVITTGGGNDTIIIGGSGNLVNARGGSNVIDDLGSGTTIILPAAGHGFDLLQGAAATLDTLDFRPLLAGTRWSGDLGTLGDFLAAHVTKSGNTQLVVTPSGNPGGAGDVVARINGATTLSAILGHSLT